MKTEFAKSRKLKKEDGTLAYSWDGVLHNWDGPALIPGGEKNKCQYFLYGIEYEEKEWREIRSQRTGVPYYKNQSMKNSLSDFRN
jgi:hypothetical protein